MRPLISIGRFSELTGLSVRALRLYEQEGLLRPAAVDPHTGYRFYRWHQKAAAERIRALRDLDVPLELIARCLHQGLSVGDVLTEHEQRLMAELRERQYLLENVQQALQSLPIPEFTVQVRRQTSEPCLSVSYRTALAHCEADRREAYQGLKQRATRLGTRPTGPPFMQQQKQTGGFNPDDYTVKLCVPVEDAVPGTEPSYSGLIAFTRHCGELTRVLHAYQAVSAWIVRSSYEKNGLAGERYLCHLNPDRPPDTEVWQPIR